jgi:hypothetical protein
LARLEGIYGIEFRSGATMPIRGRMPRAAGGFARPRSSRVFDVFPNALCGTQIAWQLVMPAILSRLSLSLLVVASAACASSPQADATRRGLVAQRQPAQQMQPAAAVPQQGERQRERPMASVSLEQRLLLAAQPERTRHRVQLAEGTTPCALRIDLTDQGGIVLAYRAAAGHERALRRAVRAMVSRHNRRRAGGSSAGGALAEAERLLVVPSVAIVESSPEGARVTLVPQEMQRLRELYAHVDVHAPDLVPPTLLVAQRCPLNA